MKRLLKIGIIVFIVSVGVGLIFSYVMKNKVNDDISAQDISGNIVDVGIVSNETIQTSSSEIKIQPDTILKFETVYKDCKHTEITEDYASSEYINLTEEELQEQYPDWIIVEFSEEEVSIYRQEAGLCNEHFKITVDDDDNVIVYKLDSNYDTIVYETTDISAEYLSDEDIQELEERDLCSAEHLR